MLPDAILLTVHIPFQELDYRTVTPVRYKRLPGSCNGICISGQWLVASLDQAVRVYSLPHLDPGQKIQISSPRYPRADDSSVYVPGTDGVSILKIHDTGNVTLVRNLTGGGNVTNVRAVALGPLKGQLLVAFRDTLVVLSIGNDTVARILHLPSVMYVDSLAVDSGQIVVTYRFRQGRVDDLYWMQKYWRHRFDTHLTFEDRRDKLCHSWLSGVPIPKLGLQDLHNIPSQILQACRLAMALIRNRVRIARAVPTEPNWQRICRGDTECLSMVPSRPPEPPENFKQYLARVSYLAVYTGSVLTSPLLTTDSLAGITASNGGFFVVDNQHSNVHIYNATGSLRYTIESVNGRRDLWLTGLTDVAVWQDCLWLVTGSGHLVLLCPG